ncbi:MAG: hypothetical protein M3Y71_05515 [Actinomycetota bacterium]|nr:hypothetical protein [Actinomycetota bacterium]
MRERLDGAFTDLPEPVLSGASWTTDAPYRETASQIAAAQVDRAVCVEMEAAALYAYATARDCAVVCLAHVSDTVATQEPHSKVLSRLTRHAMPVRQPPGAVPLVRLRRTKGSSHPGARSAADA